jgi:uncharacterized protein
MNHLGYINRPYYIKKIEPFIGKSLIKVLVGQRRIGKSYLLLQIKDTVAKKYPEKQIVFINKELHEFSKIKNDEDLFAYLQKEVMDQKEVALFIDEIQEISLFENVLRDLLARGNFDIYCTGSNANLLSGEIATLLTGRYIEIKVHALSYSEFLVFHNLHDSADSFMKYMQFGGLPFLLNFSDNLPVAFEYLKSIYNSIILKDVVARFNIRNVRFLENLTLFIANNIGSIVSAKKISDYLKSQRINISTQVVIDYINYIETSFMISRVKRLGIEGKKLFEIGEKIYFEDSGIRNAIVGFSITDIHKLLENIVYLHLKIAGYEVFVGVDGNKEVDFIAEKKGERIYVQVAYLLINEDTIKREFGNLLAINDNYSKYVVTMDEAFDNSTYLGVNRLHVKNFCSYIINK